VFDDFVFHPRIVRMPQDFDNFTLRSLIPAGRQRDGRHDDLAVAGALACMKRNSEIVKHPGIQGNDKREARMRAIAPDYVRIFSFDPFSLLFHLAAPAAIESMRRPLFRGHFDENSISMERILHISSRNKNILLIASPIVGNQKSIAVSVAAENSGNEIFASRQGIAPSFHTMNDLIRIQCIEEILETPAIVAIQIEDPHHIAKCEAVRFERPDKFEDLVLLRLRQHGLKIQRSENHLGSPCSTAPPTSAVNDINGARSSLATAKTSQPSIESPDFRSLRISGLGGVAAAGL